MAASEDQDPVEALATERPDHPFAARVGPWRANRGLHDSDPVGGEDLVEGPGELAVTIPDHELDRSRPFGELEGEVARPLGDPGWR